MILTDAYAWTSADNCDTCKQPTTGFAAHEVDGELYSSYNYPCGCARQPGIPDLTPADLAVAALLLEEYWM